MASDQVLSSLAEEADPIDTMGGRARTPGSSSWRSDKIIRNGFTVNSCSFSKQGSYKCTEHISSTLCQLANLSHQIDPERFSPGKKVFRAWAGDKHDGNKIFYSTCHHHRYPWDYSNGYGTVLPHKHWHGWKTVTDWKVLVNNYDLYGWMYDGDRSSDPKYSMPISKRKTASASDYRKISTDSNVLHYEANIHNMHEYATSHLPSCDSSSNIKNDTRYHVTCPTKNCSFHSTYIPQLKQVSSHYDTSRNINGVFNNHGVHPGGCAVDAQSYPTCYFISSDPAWHAACCLGAVKWGMNALSRKNKISVSGHDYEKLQENTDAAMHHSQANPFQLKFLCDAQHPKQTSEGSLSDPCYQLLPSACNMKIDEGPALLTEGNPCYSNWFALYNEYMFHQLNPTDKQVNELVALSRSAVDFCNDNPGNPYCKCLTHQPNSCNGSACLYWTSMSDGSYHPVQAINQNSGSTLAIDDYVCAYPPCQKIGKNQRNQLTTMAMQRREHNTCPTSTCYQIITDRKVKLSQVCFGQGIYVANQNMICDGKQKCKTEGIPTMSLNAVHHSLYYDRRTTSTIEQIFSISNKGAFKTCLRPRIKSMSIKCPEGTHCYNSDGIPHWIKIPDNLQNTTVHGGGGTSKDLTIQVGGATEMADGTYTMTIVLHDPHITKETIEQTLTLKIFVFTGDGPVPPSPGGSIPKHTGSARIHYTHESLPFYKKFRWILFGLAAVLFTIAMILFVLEWLQSRNTSTSSTSRNKTSTTHGTNTASQMAHGGGGEHLSLTKHMI